MLSAVAIAWVLGEKRRVLMEVIPHGLIEFFDKWEVRVFVILSLVLQVLMIMLGNRRKYVCKIWIRVILWCAYLLADWVAVVSLGIIAKNTIDDCQSKMKDELMWLWGQFFLLHLGGSDTITAYSLEDNELWLRHLVGLVIQTGLASYILLVSFPSSQWLPYLSLLIFIAGMIKYVERLSTLCAASSENFRDSLLSEPDPGPNYARFMEEYTLKKAEGFEVKVDEVKEIHVPVHHLHPNQPEICIRDAYDWFLTFNRLFADAILSFQDRDRSQSYFQKLGAKQAFDVVEIELGFMFDQLYTKASILYNTRGYISRAITFSFTLFSWIAFQFVCEKRSYTKLDVAITHLLLGVAVCLEVYAVVDLVDSDWTRCRLSNDGDGDDKTTRLARLIRWFQRPHGKRWSKKMAQHNLLDFCVRDKSGSVCPSSQSFLWRIRKLTKIDNHLEKHWHKSFTKVTTDLKILIFKELKSYITDTDSDSDSAAMWNRKGSFALQKQTTLDWIKNREFDQRILLWHVATDICFSLESSNNEISKHCKYISDYMLYLLIVCPYMLPIGIGMIRFRDTCAEARVFIKERETVIHSKADVCSKLLEVNTEVAPEVVKGDRCKSVLFDACRLAKFLVAKEGKWEILSAVWVEMLAHAATHCGGSHHSRQLRKGGELLTHVWLLMAHLGITEQFQISRGHARAKLIVK